MSGTMKIECQVHFGIKQRGRKVMLAGEVPTPTCPAGRVPRVARLLALAHRFEGLVRTGVVKDYADLARLGRVTRARISQIMSLLQLAPDVQEAVLFLPRTIRGRDRVQLYHLLPIASIHEWKQQRRMWECVQAGV